ncbi:MAG: [FeFe] hydrogenase H-cluster radical SAM maturase HydE [Lentisphaerae bacterium]|jgi:biotin synthase|nr:[FeFe] hydrogenase H-cluster radical SAM maturase HydE [Lentisphaerota bacterium]
MTFTEALNLLVNGATPSEAALVALLGCNDVEAAELYRAADKLRAAMVGDGIHLRALLEFSNICSKDCAYCGLRRSNRQATRYRLTPDDIVGIACEAKDLGFPSIVMQAAEDGWFTGQRVAEVVREIKEKTSLAVTLSVGERSESDYRLWREAGADRYLLRIETTHPDLFRALHPDGNLENRMECLRVLKRLGYQLGSGVMVGLPGQTLELLARDVLWLYELGTEMVGIGPFIPHPETPLATADGGTFNEGLRLVAVLRLVFPHAHIPATTAMASLDPMGRERALQAGANVLMPAVTPTERRPQYALYPGKICLDDNARRYRGSLEARIRSIGRYIASGRGDVYRVEHDEEVSAGDIGEDV